MDVKSVLKEIYKTHPKKETHLKIDGVNRKPALGLSYPKLKEISKKIMQLNAIEFLESNDNTIYELEIIQTYVIGQLKDKDLAFKYFKEFAPLAKEWSVVDALCQKFIIAKKYPDETFKLMQEYSEIDDEYMQRIVAVILLSHFINDDYIDQSINIIDQLNHQGYYCKMAKAWALTNVMVKYPDKGFDYLKKNRLDKWTHNKAIQKMVESFRVSHENKALLKTLKR